MGIHQMKPAESHIQRNHNQHGRQHLKDNENIVYPSKRIPRHRDSPKPAIVENTTHSTVTISATKIVLTRDCAKEVLVSTWIKLSSVGCA